MGLADDLAGIERRTGSKCMVAKILAELDPDDREALVAVMALPKDEVPATRIAEVLRSHGHTVRRDWVPDHRRGACNCVAQ